MLEARIQLLQRMPIFGGIQTDILQFLLTFCPVVSVPIDEFFFREHEQGDSLFVLETGKAESPRMSGQRHGNRERSYTEADRTRVQET